MFYFVERKFSKYMMQKLTVSYFLVFSSEKNNASCSSINNNATNYFAFRRHHIGIL